MSTMVSLSWPKWWDCYVHSGQSVVFTVVSLLCPQRSDCHVHDNDESVVSTVVSLMFTMVSLLCSQWSVSLLCSQWSVSLLCLGRISPWLQIDNRDSNCVFVPCLHALWHREEYYLSQVDNHNRICTFVSSWLHALWDWGNSTDGGGGARVLHHCGAAHWPRGRREPPGQQWLDGSRLGQELWEEWRHWAAWSLHVSHTVNITLSTGPNWL